jgi:hypothetical protein
MPHTSINGSSFQIKLVSSGTFQASHEVYFRDSINLPFIVRALLRQRRMHAT